MKYIIFFSVILLFSSSGQLFAQDPLEVDGIIHTTDGGVKFPDNTIQTTAAMASNPTNIATMNQVPKVWMTEGGITDTLSVLDIKSFGVERNVNVGPSITFYSAQFLKLVLTKELDDSSWKIFRNTTGSTSPYDVHLSFRDSAGMEYLHVLLEAAYFVKQTSYSSVKNIGSHANLEEIEIIAVQITYDDGQNSWCWDTQSNQNCN